MEEEVRHRCTLAGFEPAKARRRWERKDRAGQVTEGLTCLLKGMDSSMSNGGTLIFVAEYEAHKRKANGKWQDFF